MATSEESGVELFDGNLARLKHLLTTSKSPVITQARDTYRRLEWARLPVPRAVGKVALGGFWAGRKAYHYAMRMLVAQPLMEASCARVGEHLRTGSEVPWIEGVGDIVVGNYVWFDGRSNIAFASTFSERPTLEVGDNSMIGHDTTFVIAKRISIGKDCQISGSSRFFDSGGHPIDAEARAEHQPPHTKQVRPIVIGDGAWVAKHCIVFPGVTIGEGAIVSAGSVVRENVPPYTVVAGNPARVIRELVRKPQEAAEPARAAE